MPESGERVRAAKRRKRNEPEASTRHREAYGRPGFLRDARPEAWTHRHEWQSRSTKRSPRPTRRARWVVFIGATRDLALARMPGDAIRQVLAALGGTEVLTFLRATMTPSPRDNAGRSGSITFGREEELGAVEGNGR